MDLESKSLIEAFKRKYGGIKTDAEDLKRFARKFYGEDKSEGPTFLDKAKNTVKGIIEINAARKSGDPSKIKKAYETSSKGF